MDRELHDIADRMWEDLLAASPILGTFVGDDRYDDRLPDLGEDGRAADRDLARRAVTSLAALPREGWDDGDLVLADIVDAIAARIDARLDHRVDRLEVGNHMGGPATTLGEIASVQQADTPERLDRYEARLRAFPTYLAQAAEIVRESVATGVVAPEVVVRRTVAQLERLLETDPGASPALMPLHDDADAVARIDAALREDVYPAHERFLGVLRNELLPVATTTIGLADLPDGDGIYRAEIIGWTSLALEPEEIHRLGNERFDALMEERREVAADLGYASAAEAIAAHTASGANTAPSREALLAMVEQQVARCWDIAPGWFGTLPRANCAVRLVEPFREADEPFAFYNPPTEDGSRPGVYYVNAYDLDDRALHHVASVTYHEANPGHHFQIALEQEMTDRPLLRRFGAGIAAGAFAEGWGLYAERLADEMGLYLDGWERMGMLENQAHRAARLITDTGIHALGWTRQRAIAKLEEGGQTHTDSVIEVDRYIGMPAQALCYMIGMIEIVEARAKATADGLALQDFHDRVLAQGQLPLPSFRRIFGTAS
ncbi:MAG TPA: DUF885 domain-containing protein [Actinomycetota bacterium]|nr:DUF885 domain-containing protein [Actinomycetota bacterium]